MNFTLKTALLCIFCWISVSVSEFHTVEVQPGEDVTLLCSNFSSLPSYIVWFKLANRHNVSCISSMLSSESNASFCDGFKDGKFKMTSNTTTLFLKIKQVDLSHSGLYFCGFNTAGNSVIVSATHLKAEVFDEITKLTSVILGALVTVLVVLVFGLVVKISKLQTAHTEEQNPQHSENLGSDALNYAALNFHQRGKSSQRPPSEEQLESCVVFTVTRQRLRKHVE
ncbi:uncharacterized protein LOC121626930 [Chelmon rostratus]|uniref:uncharacterized protein LOC121626930 n=1 Tax=Chelmon rostratus TaxID=109905 RepID=UPI001BEC4BEB|nr:uncharacterized protein LOC121626930 [Chelmon rostratus]